MAPFEVPPKTGVDRLPPWAQSMGAQPPIRGYAAVDRMAEVLLIDDDQGLLPEQVRIALAAPKHRIRVASTGALGLAEVRAQRPDVVLLDLRLPDQSGLVVHEQIRAIDARIPVVFITGASTADSAIEAMKRGAFNYLLKPLDLVQLQDVVCEALEVAKRMRSPVALNDFVDAEAEALLGTSAAMLEACKSIGRVAGQNVAVLIIGESGTGKELVARAIYQHSARAEAPFLALNCAAIPENLLESELFGHEKGAFTGADRRRVGKFEQLSGGTLLLDEIGDMPLSLQAKILRVLQDQTFQRVGGNDTIRTDVRILAATHRDLRTQSTEGKFRADLYYRLAVSTIELPPLRKRGGDIDVLARHFVHRYARALRKDVRDIAPETMAHLRAYLWPGNVRELESVIKQALLRATGMTLLPTFLPDLSVRPTGSHAPTGSFDLDELIESRLRTTAGDLYAEIRHEVDRRLLARVLKHTKGNHRQAARILGIARQTMHAKLLSLGMLATSSAETDEDDESEDN